MTDLAPLLRYVQRFVLPACFITAVCSSVTTQSNVYQGLYITTSVAVDQQQNVYILDLGYFNNPRLTKQTANGDFLFVISQSAPTDYPALNFAIDVDLAMNVYALLHRRVTIVDSSNPWLSYRPMLAIRATLPWTSSATCSSRMTRVTMADAYGRLSTTTPSASSIVAAITFTRTDWPFKFILAYSSPSITTIPMFF